MRVAGAFDPIPDSMNTSNRKASVAQGITSSVAGRVSLCLLIGLGGCVAPYAGDPVYTTAPPPPPAPVVYGAPSTTIAVEIGDRPYYTRGPGYWVGRAYYVWRPGHWVIRSGRRVWVHGRYVLRG